MSTTDRSPARIGIAERTDSKGRTQYRGTAYDKRAKRHLRGPWTAHLAEARAWRVDAQARLHHGTLSAAQGPTIREAAEQFIDDIRSGAIRNRSGHTYKPSVIRGYERDLRQRVVVTFGATRMARLTRPEVQRWADELAAEGLAAQTTRNAVTALRALYAWGLSLGMAPANPCDGLRLPTGGKARDRVAPPAEAAKLIAALEPGDQAAFGLAVYGGLRLGEVLALDWATVDLAARVLRVERGWDHGGGGFVDAKSRAGQRAVPISDRLATLLADHRVLTDHRDGLLFPSARDPERPIYAQTLSARMKRVWSAAGLAPLSMHEARHTAASLFIASGMNAKTVSTLLGHANIATTFDRYGHLFPGSEDQARAMLDSYLDANGG